MKEIILFNKKVVLVDEEDYERLSQYTWSYHNMGYAYTKTSRKTPPRLTFLMHRFIMQPKDNEEIDHINGNRLDNRKCNLRICNRQENCRNQTVQKRNKSSIYKGVCWDTKRKKWMAYTKCNQKGIYIGHFDNEADAARAYNGKAKELFGEFAKLNEIK